MDFSKTYSGYKGHFLFGILLVFHAVGLIGMLVPEYREKIIPLSFMNLLLAFAILLINRKKQDLSFYLFVFGCFLAGMVFEWIGVHTSFLFGSYQYGENLGVKFQEIPLIIGINWSMLVICSCSLADKTTLPLYLKTIIASLLMVLLDVLIEPVAMENGYWSWEGNSVPLFNYTSWFFLSLPLTFSYFKFKIHEKNWLPIGLYFIFVVFFGILSLT